MNSQAKQARLVGGLALWALSGGLLIAPATAQDADDEESGPAHAVIERMPLALRDPETFRVSLHLEPVTSIDLVARLDGAVSSVMVEPGERLSAQQEVVRLESTERQLEMERAKAAFEAARLASESGAGEGSALAAAQLEVARFDVRLAEHRLNETIVRAPFDGTVTAAHVVPGQFVRAGDALVTLADLTRLTVDVPVSRREVSEGDSLELRVEETTVTGEVMQILPLSERFEPLRDLFPSIATARVVIDSGGGRLAPGQTVYADLIPRHPVVEIPNAALTNTGDGDRKVQVIRDGFVRDVSIQLLGQNGDEHVFVSGRFLPTDELVVESSEVLLDGTRVVRPTETAESDQRSPTRPPPPAGPGRTGF